LFAVGILAWAAVLLVQHHGLHHVGFDDGRLLVVAPIVAVALLPFCLPLILLVAVVWAVARGSRRHAAPAGAPAR
jgi:hypothetical protein